MKPLLAIVLVAAGLILFLTPALQDLLNQSYHARLMQLSEFRGNQVIQFKGEFSFIYRGACYVFGIGLIAVAVVGSYRGGRNNGA